MKNEKKLVQKFGNLLLPNLYCEGGIVLQETGEKAVGLYCKVSEFGLELYYNTVIVLQVGSTMCWKDCIAIGWVGWRLYCNTVGTEAGLKAEYTCIVIQNCIVTRGAGAGRSRCALRRAGRTAERAGLARGARGRRQQARGACSGCVGRRWGAQAGMRQSAAGALADARACVRARQERGRTRGHAAGRGRCADGRAAVRQGVAGARVDARARGRGAAGAAWALGAWLVRTGWAS